MFGAGGYGAWYAVEDQSTLFQLDDASVAVTGTGQPVGRINDKSGNGRHLMQDSAGRRPTYTVAAGKMYLSFDGADDLLFAGYVNNGSTFYAACAVYTDSTATAWARHLSLVRLGVPDYDNNSYADVLSAGATLPQIIGYRNNAQRGAIGSQPTDTGVVFESVWDGTNHNIVANGTAGTSAASTGALRPRISPSAMTTVLAFPSRDEFTGWSC